MIVDVCGRGNSTAQSRNVADAMYHADNIARLLEREDLLSRNTRLPPKADDPDADLLETHSAILMVGTWRVYENGPLLIPAPMGIRFPLLYP